MGYWARSRQLNRYSRVYHYAGKRVLVHFILIGRYWGFWNPFVGAADAGKEFSCARRYATPANAEKAAAKLIEEHIRGFKKW